MLWRPTLVARSLTLAEMSDSPNVSASCTIGTMSPPGVWTATLMSMLWYCRMYSVFQDAFTSGTFRSACRNDQMLHTVNKMCQSCLAYVSSPGETRCTHLPDWLEFAAAALL